MTMLFLLQVDYYLTSPDWSTGYCFCAAPCIFNASTALLGKPLGLFGDFKKYNEGVLTVKVINYCY